MGWIKLKNYDYPTGVAIYYNEKYVCSGAADIILENKPDCLGFSILLPKLYRDGKSRKYWIRTDPWDIEINGSPQILKFDFEANTLKSLNNLEHDGLWRRSAAGGNAACRLRPAPPRPALGRFVVTVSLGLRCLTKN